MANLTSQFKYQDTATCYLHGPDGSPITDVNGDPLWIEVHGAKSEVYQNKQNEQQNKRIQRSRNARNVNLTAEQIRADAFELVCACVADWHLEDESDKEIECSAKEVRRVLKEYPGIYEVVDQFIHDEGNFLMNSSGN